MSVNLDRVLSYHIAESIVGTASEPVKINNWSMLAFEPKSNLVPVNTAFPKDELAVVPVKAKIKALPALTGSVNVIEIVAWSLAWLVEEFLRIDVKLLAVGLLLVMKYLFVTDKVVPAAIGTLGIIVIKPSLLLVVTLKPKKMTSPMVKV